MQIAEKSTAKYLLKNWSFAYVVLTTLMEMGGYKLVARLLATAALWVRIQTSFKNTKEGDISKRVANTL